jgi:ABC-type siderophore export system fused ATPase/permease subunit
MIRWGGTFLCLVGIALTSLNIYPLNLLFGLVGSFLWTVQGYLYRDNALLIVELVAVLMYLAGILKLFVY